MRLRARFGRLTVGLLVAVLAACGGHTTATSMVVGAESDPESALLANLYAAALRLSGTAAHVEAMPNPLGGLDTGRVSVVPGFTGRLLETFEPGAPGKSDEQVYSAMVGVLPEGVAAGDYTTAAEDKPVVAVAESTAAAWGGRDLTALVRNCGQLSVGAVRGSSPPATVGTCRLQSVREFADDPTLFSAVRSGLVDAAWTSTANPDVPPDLVVLADSKPMLVRAENIVPLYRRNELTQQQLLAVNEVAGVLDTAALKDMRSQLAHGKDPRTVAEAWLAEHPPGR